MWSILVIIFILTIVGFIKKYIIPWSSNPIFATVFSGSLLFVLQKFISDFILQPYINYKKVVAKIDNKLKFYSNVIYNKSLPQNIIDEATNTIRKLSCDLETTHKMMLLNFGPTKKNIFKAANKLIFLSNIAGQQFDIKLKEIVDAENETRKILGIKKYE
jgi:hypothetical protein